MHKIIAILMVLCLLPVFAYAETAEAPGIITYDFGGFTMDLPEDILGQIGERTEGAVCFQFYPEYDEADTFHANLNAVWMSTVEDLSKMEDANSYAQTLLESIVASYLANGFGVSDAHIVAAGADEHEGKEAFSVIFNYTIDYTAVMGYDLAINQYCFQTFVADEDFGTYIFTIAADTVENAQPCMDLMNSIKWTD